MKKLMSIIFGIAIATMLFAQTSVPVYNATVELHPSAINLADLTGTWITASVGFSSSVNVSTRNINVSSVRLTYGTNSIPAIEGSVKDNNLLMLKFERSALISILPNTAGQYLLSITGDVIVGGVLTATFIGTDTITILGKTK
jgi:hypothetical protein